MEKNGTGSVEEDQNQPVVDKTTTCGLFNWRPQWLQKYATKKYYLILYSIIGIFQGMVFSYLNVVLSTVEKRFGLKSKEAAWINSGNEISQIFFIVFLPFVGRVKKRPLFMAVATLIAAAGLYIVALPHFTGDQHYLLTATLENNRSDSIGVCHPNDVREEFCGKDTSPKDWTSMGVIFFGIFLLGIATSFYYSFGLPYVDDNTEKNDSPFYLSLVMAARTIGPAFGYSLGSACLTFYVDPSHPPEGIIEGSPNWIGAWWIGFFIIGSALVIISPWLAFFPERLPSEKTDALQIEKLRENDAEPQTAKEWVYELLHVSKRLLTKPIFVLNLLSSTVFLLGVIGYFTFISKYFEYHFRQKASTVGFAGGLSNSASSAAGILASGFIMKRFRFGARKLAAWCCVADLIFILAFGVIALMACPPLTMHGLANTETGLLEINKLPCNSDCDCTGVNYQPICSRDGVTNFFSPCHAGCKLVNRTNIEGAKKDKPEKRKFYWDCSCVESHFKQNPKLTIADPWWKEIEDAEVEVDDEGLPNPLISLSGNKSDQSEFKSAAVDGYCPVDCTNKFYALLGFMFVAGIIGASTRLPNTILSLRTVDKRDKAASLTLQLSIISLFGFLPSPLIMGAIMDETCLVWDVKCGQTTSCKVYDIDRMRYSLAAFPAICIVFALLFDIGVWYYAKELAIYDSEETTAVEDEGTKKVNGTCFNGCTDGSCLYCAEKSSTTETTFATLTDDNKSNGKKS